MKSNKRISCAEYHSQGGKSDDAEKTDDENNSTQCAHGRRLNELVVGVSVKSGCIRGDMGISLANAGA